ncbi:MAG: cupin domain-containing protein [Bacteroidetes bacterium]|nr:MAG: cupin domain-containing protein [Bacteroidota bacterium]
MSLLIILLIALLIPVVYDLLSPIKYPDLQDYFKVGQVFTSKAEGVTQTVIRLEGEKLYSRITLDPGCPGPPEHIHLTMDETGTVTKGTLTMKIDGINGKVKSGDRLVLPKGHFHTFSNPSDQEVEITCEKDTDYVNVKFAYCLTKIYAIMDSKSGFKTLRLLLQLSVLHDWFDNYIAGPPIPVQKVMRLGMRPYARLLGFRP